MRFVLSCFAALCFSLVAAEPIYGSWFYDRWSLPAFNFTMNELTSPYRYWPNSQDIFPIWLKRNDHFQMFGNQRVNALAVDHVRSRCCLYITQPVCFNVNFLSRAS